MAIKDWKALLSKTQVRSEIKPVKAAAIKDFSQSLVLPKSYREYCTVFGAGFLGSPYQFTIAVPGAKFERFNLAFRCKIHIESSDSYENPDQVQRGWFFANEYRTQFFWDPLEITHKSNNEYAVYMLDEKDNSHRVADTFWDFVTIACLGAGPPTYKKYKNNLTFDAHE